MRLEVVAGRVTVEAEDLAPLLGLAAADVPRLMREGRITGLVEEGRDADAGRTRVTFRYKAIRLRFTLDASGAILSRSRVEGAAR
jgi:hypothetical protein